MSAKDNSFTMESMLEMREVIRNIEHVPPGATRVVSYTEYNRMLEEIQPTRMATKEELLELERWKLNVHGK